MKILMTLVVVVALSATSMVASAANVLVVLSDAAQLEMKDGKSVPTGFYFNELMQPVKMLLDAGHTLTFATPLGNAPTMDMSSFDKSYFGGSQEAFDAHDALMQQLKLLSPQASPVLSLSRVEQMGFGQFDALYVPGGRAPLQDLTRSPLMGRLLTHFHTQGKTTALVCHGPVALLSTLPQPGGFLQQLTDKGQVKPRPDWIYAGYKMTVMSTVEEKLAQKRFVGGEMKYMPQAAFEQAGGDYQSNLVPFKSFMVTDRELITGQNPASTLEVANELLKRLK